MNKVFRVTIAIDPEGKQLDAGVLFSTGVSSGRIPLRLDPVLVKALIEDAQEKLDESVSELSEVPPQALTTEMHKLRSVRQTHESELNEHQGRLDRMRKEETHLGRRIVEGNEIVAQLEDETQKARAAHEEVAAKLARAQAELTRTAETIQILPADVGDVETVLAEEKK